MLCAANSLRDCCSSFRYISRLTPQLIEKIFMDVQPSFTDVKPGEEQQDLMVFREFCEGLAAIALILDPNPFESQVKRVDTALKQWIKKCEQNEKSMHSISD